MPPFELFFYIKLLRFLHWLYDWGVDIARDTHRNPADVARLCLLRDEYKALLMHNSENLFET